MIGVCVCTRYHQVHDLVRQKIGSALLTAMVAEYMQSTTDSASSRLATTLGLPPVATWTPKVCITALSVHQILRAECFGMFHQGLEFTKDNQDTSFDSEDGDGTGEFKRRAEAVYLQVLSSCMHVSGAIDGSACPCMEVIACSQT